MDRRMRMPRMSTGRRTRMVMATFADLMSLMMCFFVLLLSFSEMDVIKYKQVAGSMKAAFGVQRDIEATQDPLGTSIIMQEFSPAQPAADRAQRGSAADHG
jgi:flagellar motor protein MotB